MWGWSGPHRSAGVTTPLAHERYCDEIVRLTGELR